MVYDGLSCAGLAAGEIRSIGDAARAGDGESRVKSTTSDASDERLMAFEYGVCAPECGAGVFMANHFDRHYCGKCGLTYVYENK